MGDSRPPLKKTIDADALAQTVSDSEHGRISTTPADLQSIVIVPSTASVQPPPSDPEALKRRGAELPRIGRYLLLRALGEGGMGVVYAAYDEELERKVAVKLIHPSRQGDSSLRTRILREAQALARVSAPNVVHVYQVGEVDGQLFIAMEFVNGTTLTRWQAEPGRTWQDILAMYVEAGQGLLAAHQAGLVHRDFKPDNVLIGKDGRPRVADFGLARIESKSGSAATAVSAPLPAMGAGAQGRSLLSPLTQAGALLGTPIFMSPEQHLGEPADSRSDQFSFCVALYEALYRQLPFAGNTIEALAFNTVSGKILPRPAGSHVPMQVHEAILRGLSAKPDARFPSMRELLAALSFDPTVDMSADTRSRRRVTISMIAFIFIAALGMKVLGLLNVGAVNASIGTALAFFAVFGFLAFRFRREMRNLFHRGTLIYGVVFSGQLVLLRVVGILMGLSYSQLVTLDLVALAATTAMTAALILPSLWPIVPVAVATAIAAASLPQHAQTISSTVLVLVTLTATMQWNRTVGSRVPRRGRRKNRDQASYSGG